MKLNLGCGNRYQPGWKNIDLHAKEVDVRADIRSHCEKAGSCDAIMAIHVLEHITQYEGHQFLRKCAMWLRHGAELVIETPDREKCEKLLASSNDNKRLMGAKGLMGGRSGSLAEKHRWHNWLLDVWREDRMTPIPAKFQIPGEEHKHVWTGEEIREALLEHGLAAEIQKPQHHGGRSTRDTRVVGAKL